MTPTTVHRYSWPIREAIEALLGDAAGDAAAWKIRVEDDQVVVDVVAPIPSSPSFQAVQPNPGPADVEWPEKVAEEPEPLPEPDPEPEPQRKGGELARKAGIICSEKAFWAFAEAHNEEQAKHFIYEACGVTSRVDLDHDAEAGRKFREIHTSYQNWLNDT